MRRSSTSWKCLRLFINRIRPRICIFPWPVSRKCLPQEPGRIEYSIISYICLCVILGVCLRFKPHWMFQIYRKVIKGHEELTSCSSLMNSFLFPLLDILYRQVGNLSFWTVRCTEFRHGGQYSYSGCHQGARNTMTSAWDSEIFYLSDLSYQRNQASFALSQLSDRPVSRRATFKVSRYLK